jgi:hypothetical protein
MDRRFFSLSVFCPRSLYSRAVFREGSECNRLFTTVIWNGCLRIRGQLPKQQSKLRKSACTVALILSASGTLMRSTVPIRRDGKRKCFLLARPKHTLPVFGGKR